MNQPGPRLFVLVAATLVLPAFRLPAEPLTGFRGVLAAPTQVTPAALRAWKKDRITAVALDPAAAGAAVAARAVRLSGVDLYYWIEVGRSAEVADRHPEWMASLQGHPEWRRLFPNVPQPSQGEVVKNYPWVPIAYKEAFEAHLERITRLLEGIPTPAGIFLNDLQSAPSACGCGNDLCRWTPDYGPIQTATRLPVDAAANFVARVAKLAPAAKVIPVWATECEEHDRADRCGNVACFGGACWREYTAQLTPLSKVAETIATLAPHKLFARDSTWVKSVVQSYQEMPPKRGGTAIAANRILPVLQGWDVTPEQVREQRQAAHSAGTPGDLLSLVSIDQSWQPRVVPVVALRDARRPQIRAEMRAP